jgi:hypothetical protein
MRKVLSLVAVLVAMLGLVVVSEGSASALGGESLACRVAPAPVGTPFTNPCTPVEVAATYTVGFEVVGGSGTHTYSWSVPLEQGVTIVAGCGASDAGCTLSITSNEEHDITVTLVLTQNGASETLSAETLVEPTCGTMFC